MLIRILTTLFVCALGAYHSAARAQVDCAPLDPRASISKEIEAKVQGSVNTLYKIAKAGGSIEVKTRSEIQNLLAGAPSIYREQIKLRTLYLFCGMVANAKDISTERKVDLYLVMMKVKDEDPQVTSASSTDLTN